MKLAWTLAIGLFMGLSVANGPAAAEAWWWDPDGDSGERAPSPADESKPLWGATFNPLAPLQAGVHGVNRGLKRFDAGIKKVAAEGRRFFTDAGEKLTGGRDEPKPPTTTPHLSWIRPAEPPRDREKPSWFDRWFRHEEPHPSDSVADFIGAKRLDP